MRWLLALSLLGCGRVGFGPDVPDARPIPTACVAPYSSTPDGCYRLVPTLTPWLAAEKACEADAPDAHLVVIDSVAEHFAIHSFSAGTVDVWIAYTDRVTEGVMRWLAPGGLDPTQNSCFFGSEVNTAAANCVTQMTQNACGDWFYRDCNTLHAYVCERDGAPAELTRY